MLRTLDKFVISFPLDSSWNCKHTEAPQEMLPCPCNFWEASSVF